MIELRPHFPLAGLLRTACLPRSSFYYQQKAFKTIDRHCDLKSKIREIFDRHRGRYGYRRVTAELKRNGWTINHKTVQKLMIAMQLKSLVRPKRYQAFAGAVCETAPPHERKAYVHVARGEVQVNGETLLSGDAAMLTNEGYVSRQHARHAEVLVFDLA